MSIAIKLSGFFFLFIIVTNISSDFFGYKTFGDINVNAHLQRIKKEPRKFKISVALILIEHFGIISLAVTLFIAFSPYNIILGLLWCIFRIGEALIQIYDKKSYWGLLNIAEQYSDTNSTENDELLILARNILQTKTSRFSLAQILFSVGTLAYSVLFILYGVLPIIIGWFGITAAILYGLGNIVYRIKSNFKILWSIGGLLVLFFEIILGGWLLLFT